MQYSLNLVEEESNLEMEVIESYEVFPSKIKRNILKRDGSYSSSYIDLNTSNYKEVGGNDSKANLFDYAWLRSTTWPNIIDKTETKYLVDLFSGTGPMSLGVVEAGRALGIEIKPILAIDFEKAATQNYLYNFPDCNVVSDDINNYIDGNLGDSVTSKEKELLAGVGRVDILIGGPPCQGHSDLNNHTRRNDPKNDLIFKVIRFAELTEPDHVIIENVQGIRHDKNNALTRAKDYLKKLGYNIYENLLLASQYGVAQNRRRFLLVATKGKFELNVNHYKRNSVTTFEWACGDLLENVSDSTFDTSATHAPVNRKRIEYLFEHDLHELPNHQRPKCHQDGKHSYNSVYGRMYYDQPAPTITGGFGSIGQGRFCHPKRQRSITPHEAARIQFIPDFFRFKNNLNRVALQKLIGNAVPPKLTYIITLELLR